MNSGIQDTAACRNTIGVWGDRSCTELALHGHCRNCPVFARAGRALLERTAPAGYLEEWHERIATPRGVEERGARLSLIIFRLGSEWYALPTARVREVLDPLQPHRVPHRNHPAFRGLVNVRSELLPCVDLQRLIGAGGEATSGAGAWARTFLIERDGAAWCFESPEIDRIEQVSESTLRIPPVSLELANPAFTSHLFAGERGDTGLLDDELLFHALREVCR
jgi:chemotaxis-related protein WspD